MSQIIAAVVHTFAVLLARKASVDAALTALAKRCKRKGLPVLSWSWGKAYSVTETVSVPHGSIPPSGAVRLSEDHTGATYRVETARIPLTIEGDTPKFAGWTFAATLQHLEGENIVRTVPGQEIPTTYRNRGPVCDHCKANRRRNDTYVLRHEDGRTIQVGSTCIADFLGSDDALKIASRAEILATAFAVASDDEGEGFGGFGGGARDFLTSAFLPFVAWVVRSEGWVSRTAARERGGVGSADRAWTLMTDSKARAAVDCTPTAEDTATAEAAEAWGEAITDEEVNRSSGEYLHNLRAAMRTGVVDHRTAGLIGSVVVAYQRAMGKARERAAREAMPKCDRYIGTKGERCTFGLPAKVGKKGQPLKGAPTVLSPEPVTLDFVTGYDTDFGYTTVAKFRTADGVLLMWKASGTPLSREDVGKRYTLTATIKDHSEYKGEKQTVLTRCDAVEVPPSSANAA